MALEYWFLFSCPFKPYSQMFTLLLFFSYLTKLNDNAMVHGMVLTESELSEIKKIYLIFLKLLQDNNNNNKILYQRR